MDKLPAFRTLFFVLQSLMTMEELQPFVERPTDPQVSLSISEASFAWDKVQKQD